MIMNHVTVVTDRELTAVEVNQIRDIMLHASCPNEALIHSIKNCKGLANGEIHIYRGDTEVKSMVIEY